MYSGGGKSPRRNETGTDMVFHCSCSLKMESLSIMRAVVVKENELYERKLEFFR